MSVSCRLCQSIETEFVFYQQQFARNFFRCLNCDMHFVEKISLLSLADEEQRYSQHENSKKDPGYVAFLSRLLNPVLEKVSHNDQGLDFGSGPYPMLQEITIERGYQMEIYDPFYAPNTNVLTKKYDFVTSCEVVEHFHIPKDSFGLMVELLKPGAFLGIMTSILYPEVEFSSWHYIRDDTHVCFYTPKTMEWIAKNWNLQIVYQQNNVTIFQSLLKIKG